MVLSWRASLQTKLEIEALQNNVLIKTYAETTTRSNKTIQVGDIRAIGSTSFRVRIANTVDGVDLWSDWIERSFTLTRTVPRITNFNVLDNFWEKDIRTNWRSENQGKFELEILKDNVRFKMFAGNADNNFTISKGTFIEGGDYTFRVRAIYIPTWSSTDLSYGEWVEKNVRLIDISPTLSNLALSGSNIDLALTLSFDSTDQSKVEVEVLKDTTTVLTRTGTTDKSFIFAHSTFTTGLHKFRARGAYISNTGDKWTEWKEINVTLVETIPSIGVLEPDGVIVDRDNELRVWWTSTNQTEWLLKIDDTAYTYQGSYETEKVINPGLLQTGKHKLHLTVTYVTALGVRKTITKQAEFIVQGKPPIPTFTSGNSFTTNRPTISWDTQEQQGYILDVLQNNEMVWSTGWVNGLITRQKILNYLPNGEYTIRLKIMNQFRLESDYGIQTITINALETTPIQLESNAIYNVIKLTWDNPNDVFKKFYVIRNEMVIAHVRTDTEYTDYTCNGECTYTIRGINDNDIYVDSNSVTENVLIKYSVVATLDRLDDMMNVGSSRNENSFSGSIELEHTLIHLTGREHPVSVFGEHSTNGYSFKFSTKYKLFRFLEMCRRRQVFCYRDKIQTLYLTVPNPSYIIDRFGAEYSVQANEIDFSEVVEYD